MPEPALARRRTDDPVVVAAIGLVEALSADPAFVTAVAEREIDRRIAAGLLIPAARLQVAPGLTLVPVGRVEALEDMLAEFVNAGANIPPGLADKAAQLVAAGHPDPEPDPEPEDDVTDETDPPDATDDEADDGEAEEEEEEAPAAEGKPPARRQLPSEPQPCAECGTEALTDDNTPEANLAQTRFAHTRFRRPLCRPCMASQ